MATEQFIEEQVALHDPADSRVRIGGRVRLARPAGSRHHGAVSAKHRGQVVDHSRRRFFKSVGAAVAALAAAEKAAAAKKPHLATLSFDDGFKKSFLKTAEIYEKHKRSACLNVVAAGLPEDAYIKSSPLGDFTLWNELKRRGHELMPHGYGHEHLQKLPPDQAQELVRRCLGVFSEKLEGFDPNQAVFNFPYNASTPELERWLPTQVRAFRTGGGAINPLPHQGQVKLTCTSFGPGNCEAAIDREIEKLLAGESGWLIFNTHGLNDEGWGPIRTSYLERLLDRLLTIETVEVLPAGRALAKY
jgi:peptidoglycan/xylan/chitin deacetylase (PgdA/CDA1 family)